jgi:hypothetical protein
VGNGRPSPSYGRTSTAAGSPNGHRAATALIGRGGRPSWPATTSRSAGSSLPCRRAEAVGSGHRRSLTRSAYTQVLGPSCVRGERDSGPPDRTRHRRGARIERPRTRPGYCESVRQRSPSRSNGEIGVGRHVCARPPRCLRRLTRQALDDEGLHAARHHLQVGARPLRDVGVGLEALDLGAQRPVVGLGVSSAGHRRSRGGPAGRSRRAGAARRARPRSDQASTTKRPHRSRGREARLPLCRAVTCHRCRPRPARVVVARHRARTTLRPVPTDSRRRTASLHASTPEAPTARGARDRPAEPPAGDRRSPSRGADRRRSLREHVRLDQVRRAGLHLDAGGHDDQLPGLPRPTQPRSRRCCRR